jgi:hypothetical protein
MFDRSYQFILATTHDVDDLVVLGTLVGLQVVLELVGVLGDVRSVGSVEVGAHSVVVREDRGGSSDLGTHVTDGGHTGTRERLDTGSVVFDDGTGASLDGQGSGDVEDDVCEGASREMFVNLTRSNSKETP